MYEIAAGAGDMPPSRVTLDNADGATFTADGGSQRELFFETEAQRGYESRGPEWSPGYFSCELCGSAADPGGRNRDLAHDPFTKARGCAPL